MCDVKYFILFQKLILNKSRPLLLILNGEYSLLLRKVDLVCLYFQSGNEYTELNSVILITQCLDGHLFLSRHLGLHFGC